MAASSGTDPLKMTHMPRVTHTRRWRSRRHGTRARDTVAVLPVVCGGMPAVGSVGDGVVAGGGGDDDDCAIPECKKGAR